MKRLKFICFTILILNATCFIPHAAALDRFVGLNNGTILDTQSSLIWLKDANCFGAQGWNSAMYKSNTLSNGQCSLSDGSNTGDYHLASFDDLTTFVDFNYNDLNTAGFTNVVYYPDYWTSTDGSTSDTARKVVLQNKCCSNTMVSKNNDWPLSVWPVRNGQVFVLDSLKIWDTSPPTWSTPSGKSISQKYLLTNSGVNTTTFAITPLAGPDVYDFTISAGTCNTLDPTLDVGASCFIIITAHPETSGTKTATLTIGTANVSQDIPITTTAYSTVFGTVTDQTTDLPISGATVSLFNSTLTTTTATDGSYQFSALSPGTYYVTVSKTGYWQSTAGNLVVTETASAQGDIVLKTQTWGDNRFADNQDGTITDMVSRLTWPKNANCFGRLTWYSAMTAANALASGLCGLTDGTRAGDWHLPLIDELRNFVDAGYGYDTLNLVGYNSVQSDLTPYWSGSTNATSTDSAWAVWMHSYSGNSSLSKIYPNVFVWPVRFGQYWRFDSLVLSAEPQYGTQIMGTQSMPRQVVISNRGVAAVTVSSISIAVADAANFSVSPGGSAPCASLSPTIQPDTSCTVTVTAAPTTRGVKVAALTVTSGDKSNYIPLTVIAYNSIYGTVTDFSTGLPLASAIITLAPGGTTVTAASDGSFNFGDLQDGNYDISITKTGYQSVTKTGLVVSSTASAKADLLTSPIGDYNINFQQLRSAVIGAPYSGRILAAGGTLPYKFTIKSGSLPTGLTLNPDTGVIFGAPGGSGTANFVIKVTDSTSVYAQYPFSIELVPPPVIAAATLPRGTVGSSYSATVSGSGGKAPLTYCITAGALPDGLSLNTSSGAITGTPSAIGDFTFTATITDVDSHTAGRQFAISVIPAPPAITTTRLDTAKKGIAYSFTLTGANGSSNSWSLHSGVLPAGLAFDPATGIISGTPTEAVTRVVTFMLVDSFGRTTFASYNLTVTTPLLFTTNVFPNASNQGPYSESIAMTGGLPPYTYSYSGIIPAGLSFNNTTGVVYGNATTGGELRNFTVTVKDSSWPIQQSISQPFYLEVVFDLVITTSSKLPSARKGSAITTITFTAAAGVPPYSITHVGGTLPAGITFNPATFRLSGTPTESGDFSFTLHLADSFGNQTGDIYNPDKTFTLHVSDTLSVATQSLPTAALGSAYSYPLESTGGLAPIAWSNTIGTFPNGITLNSATGVLSGIPTTGGTFTFSVQATDSDTPSQTATKQLTINVSSVLSIVENSVSPGRINTSYSANIRAQNGNTPYSWSVSNGSLPAGVNLTVNNGIATLSGTPIAAETNTFTLQVTDSSETPQTASTQFTLIVMPSLAISNTTLVPVTTGVPYSQSVTVTGGQSPYVYTVSSGSLPVGLYLNSATGAMSGTTTSTGGASFTITVTDSGIPSVSVSQAYTIDALVPVTVSKSEAVAGTVTITSSSDPTGVTCGTGCSTTTGSFAAGETVTLTAVQASGYYLASWGGQLCDSSTATTCTVTAKTNLDTVIASFSRQTATTLTINPKSQSLLLNQASIVSGQLSTLPAQSSSALNGQNISLTITAPDGSPNTLFATTTDIDGHWSVNLPGFSLKGTYFVRAEYSGSQTLIVSPPASATILVEKTAGYAIVIQGKIASKEGLSDHRLTTDNIIKQLKARSFLESNINYLTSTETTTVTKAQVQQAIEVWAKDKMNTLASPLYIVLVDHGSIDGTDSDANNRGRFHLGNDTNGDITITPAELDGWLTTMENGLIKPEAKTEKKIIIIGTCYSGSFISKLGKKDGRVVITSANDDEQSIRAAKKPDSNVQSGEYFLDEFFNALSRGKTVKDAFEDAREKLKYQDTRRYESKRQHAGVFDDLEQHPLMDDDGDGVGTYSFGKSRDGQNMASFRLGEGAILTNSVDNPGDIKATTPTQFLESNQNSVPLWLTVNFNGRVDAAWVKIRRPGVVNTSGSGGQVIIDFETVNMTLNSATGRWEALYTTFDVPGTYEIFYYTHDSQTLDISPMAHSLVYKKKAVNAAPAPFILKTPANLSTETTQPLFMWQPASDIDPVSYTLMISSTSDFSSGNLQQIENISDTFYAIPLNLLNNQTTYWWKVRAIDSFGAVTDSPVWRFSTLNTNADTVIVYGIVRDAQTMQPLNDASVTINTDPEQVDVASFGSYFVRPQFAGNYTLTANYPNYVGTTVPVSILTQGSITRWQQDIYLSQQPARCGRDNGASLLTTPTNLCDPGTAANLTLNAPWTWTCNGAGDGSSATCSASQLVIPTITSSSSTTFTYGLPESFTVTASGTPSLTLSHTGSLPAGISFIDNNNGTATISGVAVLAGNYPITINATNQGGTAPQAFILKVNKVVAAVSLGGLSHSYDSTPKVATATTVPAGKAVTFTYNGSDTVPSNVGSYTVTATINDPNYQGSATGTLVINPPTLSVSVSGNGSGSINSSPGGITCATGNTGTCAKTFSPGTVTLYASPAATSVLSGWTGCSTLATETCIVAMNANKTVTAAFILSPRALIGAIGYGSLNAAYNAAAASDKIKLLDAELVENLVVPGKDIMLDGGYSTNFTTKSGLPTVLVGTITIKGGSLRVDGVKVRP